MSNKQNKKKKIDEGIFSAARKFSDAFFDGLSKNMEDKFIRKAEKIGMEQIAIDKMKQIQKDKEELEKILDSIPKPK